MAKSVLNAPQFQSEEAAFAYVEARLWPTGPTCPFCGATSEHVGAMKGKTTRVGLKKCYACRKPFTVRKGTIFEESHLPLHLWLQVIHLMCASKKGISTRQIQRMLDCSMKTAWHLTHRIRECMNGGAGPLGGEGKTIEADTTYVGGKEKNKHRSKRDRKNIGPVGKQTVFALVERDGGMHSRHMPVVNAASLRPVLNAHVKDANKTALMTDGEGQYRILVDMFASHESVNHGAGEYVRGNAHTNTVEGFFSILKRGITGVYHNVSEHHLYRYLSEFDFRYNNREALNVDDAARAEKALQGVKGKRLTYRTTARA